MYKIWYNIIVRLGGKKMKKDDILMIKVAPDFKKQLVKDAEKKGLTLSAYVRLVLMERGK